MSPVAVNCPACGAQIVFKGASTIVAICDYCHSAIARADRNLEDLGKVAAVAETGSPLRVGLRGTYHGVAFALTGRAQLAHEAGGVWDEWYAALDDGRMGWLAEAQGRFYMTFEIQADPTMVPPLAHLEPGHTVEAIPGSIPLTVAEIAEARAISAEGEIPYRLIPGQTYYYADLSGPSGEFATLDYGHEPPRIFVGRETHLPELGFPADAVAPERPGATVAGVQLNCPKCGGPMELRAPDIALRVTCPNCGALLDVNQGRLKYFMALAPGKIVPFVPLGSVGQFTEGQLTLIGFMQRSVHVEGVDYFWEEYLLYNPQIGYRWLVRAENHWSYVIPLPPGSVTEGSRSARYNNQWFKLFQDDKAHVRYVAGEFYWRVTIDETTYTADYVAPPLMLSKEVSRYPDGHEIETGVGNKTKAEAREHASKGEVNWSLGTYVKAEDLQRAFGVAQAPPRPTTIAPNQPFPYKAIYKYWALLTGVAIVILIASTALAHRHRVFQQTFQFQPLKDATSTQIVFSEPFDLTSNNNIEITAQSSVDNTWFYADADIVDDASGLVQSISLPVEYYHGSDDEGSWSEGGQSKNEDVSAMPAGKYTLRVEAQWEHWQQPAAATFTIEQGVPGVGRFVVVLFLISIIPFLIAIKHLVYANKRWQDSRYSPFKSNK